MEFKIGDEVKLTRKRKLSWRFPNNLSNGTMRHDRVYIICNFCKCESHSEGHGREVILNIGGYYCYESDLELARQKEITNDIDWLNAVKENFKDGV